MASSPSLLRTHSLARAQRELRREITQFFCGEVLAAHAQGCAFSKAMVMTPCEKEFPIVVTTNSGYPLDLNLYQTAKGMSAAALIVRQGGTIIVASECSEGIPSQSAFERLLQSVEGPEKLLHVLRDASEPLADQWQAHIQANCQQRARVLLYSSMSDEKVRSAHLIPCHDIAREIRSWNRISRRASFRPGCSS